MRRNGSAPFCNSMWQKRKNNVFIVVSQALKTLIIYLNIVHVTSTDTLTPRTKITGVKCSSNHIPDQNLAENVFKVERETCFGIVVTFGPTC